MSGSDLVAKLGVDNTQWTAGFQKARATVSNFSSGLGSLLTPAAAAVGGALAGMWGASSSVGAYKESLEAQRKLSAVIEATGGAAGLTTDEITAFAAEMQSLTNFEDDATTAAAATLAAFTNIRGQTFTDTIESAMDLSTVMGGDLESNVKLLGKALNDPAEGLAKLARAGVTFTAEQENQIKAMQKSGDLLGAQEALLQGVRDKFGGAAEAVKDPWTQLQNTIGDVSENIGSLLLPTLNVVYESVSSLLGPIVDAGDMFKEMGIEAAVALENIGGILDLSLQQWELFFVQVGLEAAHFFTTAIPAYLTWFGDNWQNVFITVAANTLTVFENLVTNIQSAWTSLMNFFSGKPLEFNWKPLSDGFINTVEKLPDIPPRAVTDLEKGMQASINAATDNLANSMDMSRERITKSFDTSSKVPAGTIVPEADSSGGSDKQSKSSALLAGSKEAAAAFTRGIGTDKNDLAKKTLSAAERSAEANERTAAAVTNVQRPKVATVG